MRSLLTFRPSFQQFNNNNFSFRFHLFAQVLTQFDAEAASLAKSFKTSSDSFSISSLPFSNFSTLSVGGVTLRNLCKPQQASGGHLILHFNNVWSAQHTVSILSTLLPICNLRLEAHILHLSLPSLSASRRTFLQAQLTFAFRSTIQTLKHVRAACARHIRSLSTSPSDSRFIALNNLESLSSAASSLIVSVYAKAASRLLYN
ncbi:MAG: hypothetical protein ACTS6G_02570 [Candidatus Hodgkinia cicadicola]